ncbi:hypothetical protein FRX31_034800, partial [Thalictrum thalictroides]
QSHLRAAAAIMSIVMAVAILSSIAMHYAANSDGYVQQVISTFLLTHMVKRGGRRGSEGGGEEDGDILPRERSWEGKRMEKGYSSSCSSPAAYVYRSERFFYQVSNLSPLFSFKALMEGFGY